MLDGLGGIEFQDVAESEDEPPTPEFSSPTLGRFDVDRLAPRPSILGPPGRIVIPARFDELQITPVGDREPIDRESFEVY